MSVLLATVGVGNPADPEGTLLTPMTIAIRGSGCERAVLVPSQSSKPFADALVERLAPMIITVVPLPKTGNEEDINACVDHLSGVVDGLLAEGLTGAEIAADITRGTKVMSAALTLVAVRHGMRSLGYVTGERRNGLVVAGTERIARTAPSMPLAYQSLDRALSVARRGHFASVLDILPDAGGPFAPLLPERLRAGVAAVRSLATFYSAWDRLDYSAADDVSLGLLEADLPPQWARFRPSKAISSWIARLADPPPRNDYSQWSIHVGRLATDLVANGERRARAGQFEDAGLRAYRVLEMVGQMRLFMHGLDSGALPSDDARIEAFERKLLKKGSAGLGHGRRGVRQAAREQVARLLKHLGDPFGDHLMRLVPSDEMFNPVRRNDSVLIHGFAAVGGRRPEPLLRMLDDLGRLVVKASPAQVDATEMLPVIRNAFGPPD